MLSSLTGHTKLLRTWLPFFWLHLTETLSFLLCLPHLSFQREAEGVPLDFQIPPDWDRYLSQFYPKVTFILNFDHSDWKCFCLILCQITIKLRVIFFEYSLCFTHFSKCFHEVINIKLTRALWDRSSLKERTVSLTRMYLLWLILYRTHSRCSINILPE